MTWYHLDPDITFIYFHRESGFSLIKNEVIKVTAHRAAVNQNAACRPSWYESTTFARTAGSNLFRYPSDSRTRLIICRKQLSDEAPEIRDSVRTSSTSSPERRLRKLLRTTSLVNVVPTERPTTEPRDRKR